MPPLIVNLTMCIASTILGIAAYDRIVVRPATAIGVVDTLQVYREQEAHLVKVLSANPSEGERAQAVSTVRRFAERLPLEMAHLAEECACLVLDRTVVVGMRAGVRDMTPKLRERVLR
jgi:hypothetical protein